MSERSALWNKLVTEYWTGAPVPPALRGVTLAQWAIESDWGNSALAKQHFNFGGMKFRQDRVGHIAAPVSYDAHDGNDTYARFASVRDWITGYWAFIDAKSAPYKGWRDYLMNAEGYIKHLKKCGYAQDKDYVKKVMSVYKNDLTPFERTGKK